jgi:hypothetical protein
MSDFDLTPLTFDLDGPSLTTDAMPPDNVKHTRRDAKRRYVNAMRRQWCMDKIDLPAAGVSVHIVSNARYDLWDMVPAILKKSGAACLEWIGSTWCLNRRVITELLEFFDAGQIKSIKLLTGQYLKSREPAVFATAAEGLLARGQHFRAAQNHAKLFGMLMSDGAGYVVETSANLVENGNVENHCITNDAELFRFHRAWIDDVLSAK